MILQGDVRERLGRLRHMAAPELCFSRCQPTEGQLTLILFLCACALAAPCRAVWARFRYHTNLIRPPPPARTQAQRQGIANEAADDVTNEVSIRIPDVQVSTLPGPAGVGPREPFRSGSRLCDRLLLPL